MRVYVVVATKGRVKETRCLLDYLLQQTLFPDFTAIVGTEVRDIEGLEDHALFKDGLSKALISPRMGATAQRNVGIECCEQFNQISIKNDRFFCAFFDDDFRPHQDWLKCAAERFTKGNIVGLTGQILADGINTGGLTEAQAKAYISGETTPQSHWASGPRERVVDSVYGCNMAFLDTAVRQIRFDENLPLYGWQEDRDYTGMAKKFGHSIYFPDCRGVHLGTKKGRTSGIRFGYSQIANPVYLMKKGTMGYTVGVKHMARNFIANIVRSLTNSRPHVDYRGRLRGNWLAIVNVLTSRSDPRNILKLK